MSFHERAARALALRPGHVLTGRWAAAAWGMPVVGDLGPPTLRLPRGPVAVRGPLLVQDRLAVVRELVPRLPLVEGVALLDHLRHQHLVTDLAELVVPGSAGAAATTRAWSFSHPDADGLLETGFSVLVQVTRLGPLELKECVDGRGHEYDGRIRWARLWLEQDGWTTHGERERWEADHEQSNEIACQPGGERILRLTYRQLFPSPLPAAVWLRRACAAAPGPRAAGLRRRGASVLPPMVRAQLLRAWGLR